MIGVVVWSVLICFLMVERLKLLSLWLIVNLNIGCLVFMSLWMVVFFCCRCRLYGLRLLGVMVMKVCVLK